MERIAENEGIAKERLPLANILTYTSPALGIGFMFFLVNMSRIIIL